MNDRDIADFDQGQCILTTYDENGFLGIGVDVPGGESAGTSTFAARMPYGTFCRPRDPDVAANGSSRIGARVLYAYFGTDRAAWPLDDPRMANKLPLAPKGSWGAYGDTGRAEVPILVLDGTTGSFALRVPHAPFVGVASRILVDVENAGAEEIVLAHGGGCEVRVRAAEAIVGDVIAALPLAKAGAVDGIVAALQALAASFIPLVGPLAPLSAIGTTLQTALGALPPIPTTKLRAE